MTFRVKYIPTEFESAAHRAIYNLWQKYRVAGMGGSILHRAAEPKLRRLIEDYEYAREWPLDTSIVILPGEIGGGQAALWDTSIWDHAVDEWSNDSQYHDDELWHEALAFLVWWNDNPWGDKSR
jgi:hypothetical protein